MGEYKVGIFDKKHDDTQTIKPSEGAIVGDAAIAAQPNDGSLSTPQSDEVAVVQTAPPLVGDDMAATSTDDTDGYLTTDEPVVGNAPSDSSVSPVNASDEGGVQDATLTSIVDGGSDEANFVTSEGNDNQAASSNPYADIAQPTPLNNISAPDTVAKADDTANPELATIKESALKELSSLVDLLDQTPEERFHTTMMMLQSTDNKSMLKEAYEAAQAITDQKVKAQALLDIVNEINYYTQPTQ